MSYSLTTMPHHRHLMPGRVGKTSLLARYIHNVFKEDQQATVQAAFMSKQLDIDSHKVTVTCTTDFVGPTANADPRKIFLLIDVACNHFTWPKQ